MTNAVLPHRRVRGSGRIINVSSGSRSASAGIMRRLVPARMFDRQRHKLNRLPA